MRDKIKQTYSGDSIVTYDMLQGMEVDPNNFRSVIETEAALWAKTLAAFIGQIEEYVIEDGMPREDLVRRVSVTYMAWSEWCAAEIWIDGQLLYGIVKRTDNGFTFQKVKVNEPKGLVLPYCRGEA